MIAINKKTQDIHFRYKMPNLIIKHEGKNTGIKTIIVNLEDIAKSLSRNADVILKYFSYSLSLQTKHDGKFIVNGKHDQNKMQNIIYDFIDHFVLCYNCENPETFFILDPNLKMECLACGSKTSVREHKINIEICKNISTPTSIYTDYIQNEETENNEECKNKGLTDEEIVFNILKEENDDFSKLDLFIEQIPSKVLLGAYEDYVEKNKKYENISKFIDYALEKGLKRNEISKYYTRPQGGKKRSIEFKKEINKYFN